MDNQEYYDEGGSYSPEAYGSGTAVTNISSLQPVVFSQRSGRLQRREDRRVEKAAIQERGKARMAQEVIICTTALSSIADSAIRAVPSAEAPVRRIVNVYAESSAQRLARW